MACVFCSIVDGTAPSRVVYDTDTVLAFLDVNPLASGHTLVIPKAHHERFTDLDPPSARALMDGLHRVTSAVETSLEADGTTIGFNDGSAAGQEVPHVHGHVIPRQRGDGAGPIHAMPWARPTCTDTELDGIADRIAAVV